MQDHFSYFHPLVSFLYFAIIIIFTMFFMHPVLLIISLLGALTYALYLRGRGAFSFIFLFLIPMLIFVILINPLFSHEGLTILGYFRGNPITLESIYYGFGLAIMFGAVFLWFFCYNRVVSGAKLVYIFGKILPASALIISMAFRFVPLFKERIMIIARAQKALGRDVSQGNIFFRIKNAVQIVSIMITWSLENSLDTADSMKARGYGLPGRSSFNNYFFTPRDGRVLALIFILAGLNIFGAFAGLNKAVYYPMLKFSQGGGLGFWVWGGYFILSFLPLIINCGEEIRWRYWKSKI